MKEAKLKPYEISFKDGTTTQMGGESIHDALTTYLMYNNKRNLEITRIELLGWSDAISD